VQSIVSGGVNADELAKAKNAFRASRIAGLETSMGRAEALQEATMYLGDSKAVTSNIDRFLAVTVDDIKRVAAKYLRPDNSTIVLIKPETKTP
jgi:zinc protease